MESRYINLG